MRPLAHLASRVAAGAVALAIAHAAHAPAASAESCKPPRQLGVVFVLDDSGSMAQSDAGALRATGAGAGLRELGAGSVAAAVSFSSDAQPIFGPTVLDSANAGPLTDLIAASLTSSGGTDFDPAFAEAKRQLDAMPASVDRKAVLLLSDGDPNVGYDQDEPIAAAGIPIDTVGFGTRASAVLDGIAQRSGGKSVYVGTVEEAQGALARAVARLACKPVNEPESVTLVPGGSRDVPFDVPAGTGSFTALAVWGQGHVRAKLIRPDGSAMGPRTTLPGESFEEQASLVRATAAQPATGKWRVRLVADGANAESVRVTVELFGTPRLEHPLVTRPQPAGPGCETQVEVFGRVAWSSCFRAVAGGWRTTTPMRIAGLDIEPRGTGVLIRGSGRLTGTGRMFVTTSGPELGGGELTLVDGDLDIPLRGGRLLAPDLSKRVAASRIGGLRVVGKAGAELGWSPAGANLKLAVDLGRELEPLVPATSAVDPAKAGPALKPGFGLEVDLSTTNARGLAVDRIEGHLDTSKLFGALPVRSLALAYDAQHNIWTGGAKVALFGNVLPSLDAELGVTVNPLRFAHVNLVVNEINRPIGAYVFLQKLGGELTRVPPPFTLSGEVGLSAGPELKVPGIGAATLLEVDGSASYSYPAVLKASAGVKLLRQRVSDTDVELNLAEGTGSAAAWMALDVAGSGLSGRLDGWLAQSAFQLAGDVGLDLFGKRVSGGQGFVSSRGMGACRHGFGPDFCWTAEFGKDLPGALHVMASSCDFGALAFPARPARSGGAEAVTVAPRTRGLLLRIRGIGGPPAVKLRSAGGVIDVPLGVAVRETREYTAIRDERARDLWIVLNAPPAGRLSIEPLPGSAPLADVGRARAAAASRLRASVRPLGAGRYRVRWSGRAISGQTFRFVERGPGGLVRAILRTSRSGGALDFRPAPGPAGRRRVEVTVEQRGMPRSVQLAGRFRTPRLRPAAPTRVRVRRRARTAEITWRRVARAYGYRVMFALRDGRRLERVTTRRRIRLDGVRRTTRGRVAVRAIAGSGVVSRAAHGRLR